MSSSLKSSWRVSRQTVFGASRSVFILSLLLVSGFWILASFPAQAIIDTNQNGASDPWERHHNNGNLFTAFDPTADLDGDGWTNEQEAITGTNPSDGRLPAGFLRPIIERISAVYLSPEVEGGEPTLVSPETVSIRWNAITGKKYTVFASTDLTSGSWIPIGQPQTSHPYLSPSIYIPLTQPDGSIPEKLFFRVSAEDTDTDSDTLTDYEENQLGSSSYSADGDYDGLSDPDEFFVYQTNFNLADSDNDGVTDGDEILFNFTNPLSATDADEDGIPDDFEKHFAKLLLAYQSEETYWEAYHAGLLAGNLDATHDYTGDGINARELAKALKKITAAAPTDSGYTVESETRRNSLQSAYYYPPGSYSSSQGTYYHSVPDNFDEAESMIPTANLNSAYLLSRIDGVAWQHSSMSVGDQIYVDSVSTESAFRRTPVFLMNGTKFQGRMSQQRCRIIASNPGHKGSIRNYLKLINESNYFTWNNRGVISAEPFKVQFPKGRMVSDWYEFKSPFVDETGGRAAGMSLIPVDLISDLNNDGQITAADNVLRDAAMASGATDEIKDKDTEFIFHNDTLSNGIWDKEDTDPARPATEKDDDDAEEIVIKVGISEGEVWLDHPAIARLSFYKNRECNAADKVNLSPTSKFTVSVSNPFPPKLFMRADGTLTYPEVDPQFEGDLVLKIKVGTAGQEIEAVKMKLTVVKAVGAKKYFHTARDYMFENNSKLCVRKETVGNLASPSYKRFVSMLHEKTEMKAVDSFHRNPKLYGIDAVAAGFSAYDVAVNGNFCFHSGLFSRPARNAMTDRCHGRLVTSGVAQPCSSAGGSSPYESPISDFIKWNSQGGVSIGTGEVPAASPVGSEALGGLGSNIAQYSWHPWFGIANASDKKVFFNVMPYTVDSTGAGGGADLKNRLMASGCPPLPGGQAGEIQCIYGDGGSSLALAYKVSGSGLTVRTKGEKHFITTGTGIGRTRGDYFINTYLLFKSQNPR